MQLKQQGVRANIIRYVALEPASASVIRLRKKNGFPSLRYHLMHPGKGAEAMRRANKAGLLTVVGAQLRLNNKPINKKKFLHLDPSLRREWMKLQQYERDKQKSCQTPQTFAEAEHESNP